MKEEYAFILNLVWGVNLIRIKILIILSHGNTCFTSLFWAIARCLSYWTELMFLWVLLRNNYNKNSSHTHAVMWPMSFLYLDFGQQVVCQDSAMHSDAHKKRRGFVFWTKLPWLEQPVIKELPMEPRCPAKDAKERTGPWHCIYGKRLTVKILDKTCWGRKRQDSKAMGKIIH